MPEGEHHRRNINQPSVFILLKFIVLRISQINLPLFSVGLEEPDEPLPVTNNLPIVQRTTRRQTYHPYNDNTNKHLLSNIGK